MWLFFLALCLADPASAPANVPAAPPPAGDAVVPSTAASAEADVRRLLELTGADRLATQSLDTMISGFRAAMPEVPPEVWVELRAELRVEDLLEQMVRLYQRRFTPEEIKELLVFYESPLGRRLLEEQPAFYAEATKLGQEWGVEASHRALTTLKARGVVF